MIRVYSASLTFCDHFYDGTVSLLHQDYMSNMHPGSNNSWVSRQLEVIQCFEEKNTWKPFKFQILPMALNRTSGFTTDWSVCGEIQDPPSSEFKMLRSQDVEVS